jgi:hypothetical protein
MLAYYGPEWKSLESRMVDRWCTSFSGNTGLQFPSTMGRNHGVLTNFANNGNDAYVASPDRLALNFDGSNDYVTSIGNLDSFAFIQNTMRFSLSFWMKLAATGTRYAIAGNTSASAEKGFWLRFENGLGIGTRAIGLFVTRGVAGSPVAAFQSSDNAINDTEWHHVAVTAAGDGDSGRIFVDGKQLSTTVQTNLNALSTGDSTRSLTIASQTNGFTFPFGGQLDDFIIFNTALSPNEVRFIYEQGRGGGLLMQPPRRRSFAAIIAALVLACETANYSLTGQAAGVFASRLLAADQAQYLLSGNAANVTASRLLSADPASYTATGNDAATICARLLDGGAAAYALTGTDAGLIANRKLTADQAVYFLAGNNAELLRSLKLNAGSMAMQIDNFAASLLADRKISADGAQYILVVSDANLGDSASGVAPYYYLFMLRGPQ